MARDALLPMLDRGRRAVERRTQGGGQGQIQRPADRGQLEAIGGSAQQVAGRGREDRREIDGRRWRSTAIIDSIVCTASAGRVSTPCITPGQSCNIGAAENVTICREEAKADARTRTGDPFITSEVLYQLSYVGVCRDFPDWRPRLRHFGLS